MELYKELYLHLFREIEKAIVHLNQNNVGLALDTLRKSTEYAEEMYVCAETEPSSTQ